VAYPRRASRRKGDERSDAEAAADAEALARTVPEYVRRQEKLARGRWWLKYIRFTGFLLPRPQSMRWLFRDRE
jgi:hypothetical protein